MKLSLGNKGDIGVEGGFWLGDLVKVPLCPVDIAHTMFPESLYFYRIEGKIAWLRLLVSHRDQGGE